MFSVGEFKSSKLLLSSCNETKMGNFIGYSKQKIKKRSMSLEFNNMIESNKTFDPFRNLYQLHVQIIIKIIDYLSFADILNLRITFL